MNNNTPPTTTTTTTTITTATTTIAKTEEATDFYAAILAHTKDLTKSDIVCYYTLGLLGNDKECQAWQSEIAEQAGMSGRQVQRSLKRLESIGLISIDRSRRYHMIYRFTYPKPVIVIQASGQPEATNVSSQSAQNSSTTIHTNTIHNSREDKTSTSKNGVKASCKENQQLDSTLKENLKIFGINPNIRQPFPTAPSLIKKHTPTQVLLAHDPDGCIAENLACWSEAWREKRIDLSGLKPALIWCKIVEGQDPPLLPPVVSLPSVSSKVDEQTTEEAPKSVVAHNDSEPQVDLPEVTASHSDNKREVTLSEAVVSHSDSETQELPSEDVTSDGENDPQTVFADDTTSHSEVSSDESTENAESNEPWCRWRPIAQGKTSKEEVVWAGAMSLLEGQMPRTAFNETFARTGLAILQDGEYTILFVSPYARDWAEFRLKNRIRQSLEIVTKETNFKLKFALFDDLPNKAEAMERAGLGKQMNRGV